MLKIEDYELEYAERMLLPPGDFFDDQRRAVIRCMESKDVQACPGSGKTTTLLAKLSILAQKLPLKNNKGICVLTHTNVAVNEIKERLDDKADILFQYPNHFGTIQSFVNKYLGIPAFVKRFGKRPARIDDEIHQEYIQKKWRSLPFGTRTYIERARVNLSELRFSLNDFNVISKTIDGTFVLGPTTTTYQHLKSLKEDVLREGILCYDDAYSLAYWYLREYPQLSDIISERFSYIFIDEMQDTDLKQQGILEKVFDLSKVIVQRIGDSNQAIYTSSWQISENPLSISESKRFSSAIAEKVKHICLTPQNLIGNQAIPNINPKLIIFDDDSISMVLSKFGDLIFENQLHLVDKKIYKAIGWVGQPNTHRTLPSYFESFGKSGGKQKQDYDSLLGYLKVAHDKNGNPSVLLTRQLLLRAILKSLRVTGTRRSNNVPYTEKSFIEFLGNEHNLLLEELKFKLLQWCTQLFRNEDIVEDIKSFIIERICGQFGSTINHDLRIFLNAPDTGYQAFETQKTDTFAYERESIKFNIDVSSVHSVKGETHTATLYLETFYRKYDIQSIIEYMKGKHTPPKTTTLQSSLKTAYVGMTRPTHLLCVAAHKNGCEQHLEELAEVGWEIHRI